MSAFVKPTLNLLNSATIVGFTGGLRLYLAFLFAGLAPNLLLVLAASLIIYATYTLDRSLDNTEDDVNHAELAGAWKTAGLAVSGIAIMVGAMLFFAKSQFWAPVFPFVVGVLYSKGIPVRAGTIKLKGGYGIKNLVIGLTWGGTIGLVIAASGAVIPGMVIALYFGMKLFINSTIFDLKDVKGDLAAGIRTLPVVLGERKLKLVLFAVLIVQHLILFAAMAAGILTPYPLVFLYSFLSIGTVIALYSPSFESSASLLKRRFRNILVNGESPVAIAISTCLSG